MLGNAHNLLVIYGFEKPLEQVSSRSVVLLFSFNKRLQLSNLLHLQ